MESNPKNPTKFLYSYGGKILPRHTRSATPAAIPESSRSLSPFLSQLMVKFVELCGSSVKLKCSLPNGDLETLISITSDEDLANIIEEYNRASSLLPHPLKIRAILSPPKSLKKVSPPQSSSSSATYSPSGSFYASVESLPYAALNRLSCSPVSLGFPIGVRNGAVKGGCYRGQLHGSPRFVYGFGNNYCQ